MTVLVLSSSSPDLPAIIETVVTAGHEAALTETSAQALARIARGGVDLVLLDLAGGADALRFLRRFATHGGSLPVVCIADRRQPDAAAEALRLGIVDIVGRPVRSDDILAALANARELARIAQRAAAPVNGTDPVDGLFGASPAMRDVLGIVRRVAHSRCGVLIVGERGTGREMIARAIHAQGPRRDAPFIKISGGERTNGDLSLVLDGGAAPGSTVYLENIAELSLEGQARLEHRMTAPGSPSEPLVRVIASAEPRIGDWMDRGIVRKDLIDALGTVRIDLPALRQRAQDVPLLATYFLKDACRRNDLPAKTFSRSALILLAALPWPGNASELRSFAERLAVLVPRGVVLLEDVLANTRMDGIETLGRPREPLREARDRFERDYITFMLQHHRGRMGAAARELGIERTNLYRKIKQLKVRVSALD
jgi:two-component system nitrogen regulation response regulator NtrX